MALAHVFVRTITTLSCLLLLGSQGFLLADPDPIISPEFGLDEPVLGPSPCTRAAPAVAVNFFGYLVAWTHGKGEATAPGVYAARVDPLGNLLDPHGILVSSSAGEQSRCQVAALGDEFLVAWSAPRGNSSTDWDVLGARLRWDGTLPDPTPLPLCALAGTVQNSPAVAANGNNYLVVWTDSRSSGIYGTIVASDGRLYPTNGFPITTASYEQFTPAVAALGTNYMVVWQDYRNTSASSYASDIYGARVSGSGVLLDTTGIPICRRANSQYQPAVAANGSHYLVVWEDYDISGNDILATRVTPDGIVVDTNALVVAHAANSACNPSLSANYNDFLVIWQDYRSSPGTNFAATTFAARVRNDGSVAYPESVALSLGSAEQSFPAVAGFWDDFLVVWQDTRNNPDSTLSDIYGAVVESGRDLFAYPDVELSNSVNIQLAPKLAVSGTNFLAVWTDNRNGTTSGWDIFGAWLDERGSLLGTSAIPLCTNAGNQTDAVVAAQGTNLLVVWTDLRNALSSAPAADIYGAFVDTAGRVTPAGGFPICRATNSQTMPGVTALADGYLVVWQDARNSIPGSLRWDIYGSRVSTAGEVLDPDGIGICTKASDQIAPVVAGNAKQALVVYNWTAFRSISAARVAADGTLLDTNDFRVCIAAGSKSNPAVAGDGSGFLVVWTDGRKAAGEADVYGALISADAVVSPTNGFPIRVAPGLQTAPAVAFNGLDYLVAWQEARSSSSNSFDIFGASVTQEGVPFSAAPLFINTNPYDQLVPAVAALPDGPFLVLSQGLRFLARRALGNLVNLEAIPRLDGAGFHSGGQFQFRLRCAPGLRYAVEVSEDLDAWVTFETLSSTNSSMWLTDPATNLPNRFYRASLVPP